MTTSAICHFKNCWTSLVFKPQIQVYAILDANKQEEFHEGFVAEVMLNITPDAEHDEKVDSDREQADLQPPSKNTNTGLGMLLGDMFTMPRRNECQSGKGQSKRCTGTYMSRLHLLMPTHCSGGD